MENMPTPPEEKKNQCASKTALVQQFWTKFTKEYSTIQACVEALYRLAFGHDIQCPRCGHEKVRKLNNSRIIICKMCKKESHTLAGTLFNNIRHPRAWLGALWFMQQGIKVSANGFSFVAGIASSSSQTIFKRLTYLLFRKMEDLPELPSADFLLLFTKRSRLSVANQHPHSEQNEYESLNSSLEDPACKTEYLSHHEIVKSNFPDEDARLDLENPMQTDDDDENSRNEQKELTDITNLVLQELSSEPIHVDVLCQRLKMDVSKIEAALIMLELEGLLISAGANRYSLNKKKNAQAQTYNQSGKILVDSFTEFVKITFHGISRRYLQNYLAWYWCASEKNGQNAFSFSGSNLCRAQIRPTDIEEYVTPLFVKAPTLPESSV